MDTSKNKFAFWLTCLVSTGGILYGYDIGVISGALLFIKSSIPMSETRVGMIVGAVLCGALVGTLLASPIGDYYGRRFLIMFASIVFIFGIGLILNADSFITLLYARLSLGIGVGIVAVAVPLYISEMVLSEDRGKYVNFFQLLITFGIVSAYIIDLIFTPSGNWHAMFAVVLMPAIILLIGMFFMPETPRWLIAKGKTLQARNVLQRLHKTEAAVDYDILHIQKSLQTTAGKWTELFSPQFVLATLIAISVSIFNQLTGINSFLQYAPLILKNAGIGTNVITMVASTTIGILNFLATLIAMAYIDSIGRRPLLLIGVFGIIVAECFLGVVNFLSFNATVVGILSLLGLLIFIVSFAIGPGMVIWLVTSELFPTRMRAKGISLCLFFHVLTSALLSTFFLNIVQVLGMAQTYWLFGSFSLGYFLLAFYLLPETKSKTLEEIQLHFQERT